jgi:hypothetical protein
MKKFLKKYYLYLILAILLILSVVVFFNIYRNTNKTNTEVVNLDTKKTNTNMPVIDKVSEYTVPILMYHYIRVAPVGDTMGQDLSVTPTLFDSQVKWFSDNGYATIKMSDLADTDKKAISLAISQKKKPIVFTFDDGYDDAYTQAMPILQKYGFTGTFYIIRNYVGKPEYLTKAQIDKMSDAGMEIGSHTLSHPDLKTASEETQRKQIFESKEQSTSFCYPAGKFSDLTVSLVKEALYTTAVTTVEAVSSEKSDLFKLPRVRVKNISAEALANKINNDPVK